MASSRIISRLIVPTTRNHLSRVVNTSVPVRYFFNRNPKNLPDLFFGSSTNVFRDLEREFERMQRQFDNFFRGTSPSTDNRSLTNFSRGGTNGKYFFSSN